MDKYPDDVVERFWTQVDQGGGPDACWNWTGTIHTNGYGVFNLGMRQELAHRVALELSGVEIPPGFVAMQTCRNRLCCNPVHLRIGTRAEQMAERSRLRRVRRPKKQDE